MCKYSIISTTNNVFSVQLRLACRKFVSKLLDCVLQLFSFSDQRLLLLLFQSHKTFHVEEQKRTQHSYCCFNSYCSLSSESLALNFKCVLLSQSYSISLS